MSIGQLWNTWEIMQISKYGKKLTVKGQMSSSGNAENAVGSFLGWGSSPGEGKFWRCLCWVRLEYRGEIYLR